MIIEGRKRNNYSSVYDGTILGFRKNKPSLSNRQIAVYVKITVPNAFFERLTPVVEIELPEEAVVSPNIKSVIKLTALEVADKLQLEVEDVEDGLATMIKEKSSKGGESV